MGSYPITVTLGPTRTTTVTKTDATLTVNPAVATVTANAKSKTYGAANPTLDAVVDRHGRRRHARLQPGDDGHDDLGRGQLPDHGDARRATRTTTVTTTDAHADGRPKAAATVTANAKSKTYGAANPTLDAVVTGTVGGDTLNYSLATTATTTSGVGSYPITVTLGTNPNYDGDHDGRDADGDPRRPRR